MRTGPLSVNRYPRITVRVMLVAALCLAALAAMQQDAAASTQARSKHSLTRKERAAMRRDLARRLRHNPALVFKRSFIKKAEVTDFRLPLTVRLNKSDGQGGYLASDDQLEITWDDAANPWPLGAPAAVQTTLLSGSFTMEGVFSDTTGLGELGAIETVNGGGITMSANPFTIAEFNPTCVSGPELVTTPNQPIAITSAGPRYGVLNMFAGTVRGSLNLRMTFSADVTDTCGGTTTTTPVVDNSAAIPMPVHFDGKFYVSPAITADGKMRFGKIVIDDAVIPQLSSFAFVRSCTVPTTCNPQQFPARLKIKTLTAEVLLGDIRP